MNAKLTIGQYDTESSIFDSFHFSGISLKAMRICYRQTYVVTHRKSRVSHKRMQRSLSHRTTVLFIKKMFLRGPFAITNLFNTLQGQLDVKVEEEDGRVTQWQVASNSIPYLTRKGQIRYTTAMGKTDQRWW